MNAFALIAALAVSQIIPQQHVTVIGGSDKKGDSHATAVDTFGSTLTRSTQDIFTATTPITVGNGPRGVTIADIDGDGYQDILVAERGSSNDIRIFWGSGNGLFSNKTVINVGQGVNRCKVADFNGDKIQDLACASTGGFVVVVIGGGSRAFATPQLTTISGANVRGIDVAPLGSSPCESIAFGDLNASHVGVMLGSCDGGFAAPVYYATGAVGGPYDVAIADMDQDGIADLVLGGVNNNVNPYGILIGQSNGTFAGVYTYNPVPLSQAGNAYLGSGYFAIGDLNNDGVPDIAYAGSDGVICTALNLQNTSVGTQYHVTMGEPSCAYNNNGNYSDVVLADINGDHYLDVLSVQAAYGSSDYVGGQGFIGLININAGQVSPNAQYTNFTGAPGSFGVPYGPYGIATGDLNGDGIVDVVYSDTLGYNENTNGVVRVYLGNPEMFVGRGAGASSPQIPASPIPNNQLTPRICEQVAVTANGYNAALDLHPSACLRVICSAAVNGATGDGLPYTGLVPGFDAGTLANVFSVPAAIPQFMCLGNTISASNATPETGIAFQGIGAAATCNVCQLNPR